MSHWPSSLINICKPLVVLSIATKYSSYILEDILPNSLEYYLGIVAKGNMDGGPIPEKL